MSYKLGIANNRYNFTTFVEEDYRDYIILDGKGTDRIVVPTFSGITSIPTTTTKSIEGWFRFDGFGVTSSPVIMSKGSWKIQMHPSYWQRIRATADYSVTDYYVYEDAETLGFAPGDWFHIYFTSDFGYMSMAVNGVWTGGSAGSGTYTSDTSDDLVIGNYKSPYAYPFNGAIGWVRATSGTVRRTPGVPFTPPSRTSPPAWDANTALLLWLDEGTGTNIDDRATGDNDGTLTGGAWAKETAYCIVSDGGLRIDKPSIRSVESYGTGRGGTSISETNYGKRNISIEFEIIGDTFSDIMQTKAEIAAMIDSWSTSGSAVNVPGSTLVYSNDGLDDSVQFDILRGWVTLPEDFMSLEKQSWTKGDGAKTVKGCMLDLECRPFARGLEYQVASDNANFSTDGYYENSISFKATKGDVQSPARIRFYSYTSGWDYEELWVGIRDTGLVDNFVSTVEAEDGVYSGHGGTLSSKSTSYSGDSGDATGGYRVNYSVTGTTARTLLWESPASPDVESVYDIGQYIRVIATGSFQDKGVYQMAVDNANSSEIQYFRGVRASAATVPVLDLGTLPCIPGDAVWDDFVIPQYSELELYYTPDDASETTTINLDCFVFIPVGDYKYKRIGGDGFEMSGSNNPGATPRTEYMEDAVNGRVVMLYNDVNIPYDGEYDYTIAMNIDYSGMPIYLTPNINSKLFITAYDTSGLWVAGRTIGLWIYSTPYYIEIPQE